MRLNAEPSLQFHDHEISRYNNISHSFVVVSFFLSF